RLGTVFGVVAAICAVGAFFAVREYTNLLFDAFRERSIGYVQAFVASIDPWLDPVDEDMLRLASHLMMAGSPLFIRLEIDGQPILDERPNAVRDLALEISESPSSATANLRSLPDGSTYLDVIVPISGISSGYGRIGIDRTTVVLQARHTALLAMGSAVLFLLIVLGGIVWAVRRPQEKRVDSGINLDPAQLTVGPLAVDLDAKGVMLDGVPVPLTPKQFRLLSFLAERADRVCSDEEILEGVWPDSPYADGKDVKQYIYLVRSRLAAVDPREKTRIKTVPGFGYMLVSNGPDPIDPGMTAG
ncbi:winged helix-turn-helix transcriptional regulator, partial [Candidatus Bipolaricaulota bacterium]|nr:winged helix-turn-helix transcriptional regulator [Candidatus Bipolaricaulota bacterium]